MNPKHATTFSINLALAALACIMSAPTFALDYNDERLVQESYKLSGNGHFKEAANILKGVLARNPRDTWVLVQLGHVSMNELGDLTHATAFAETCFRKAIAIDPQYGRAYKKLGEWYNQRGEYQKGLELCGKALTVKKPDLEALRERAGAYSNLHRDKEALADVDEYIRVTKGKPRDEQDIKKVIVQRAGILENLKRYDQAIAVYRDLLKQHYEDSIVLREVACLRAAKKPEEALKSLNKLIAHNKADDVGYLNRARLYESLGKHKEAVSDYSSAIELSPATTYLKERASVYDKMGRKDLGDRDRKEAENL